MANLVLLIIVAVIALVLIVIRANTGLVFLALCSGEVLVNFANKNVTYINGHINQHLLPRHFTVSQPALEIAILVAPAILVAILVKHSSGASKWLMQIFPAIATGLLASLFIVPLLSLSLQNHIVQNHFWGLLEQYQMPIVAAGVVVSIIVVSFTSHGHRLKSKHSH